MQRLDLKTSMKYDIFWSEGQDLVKKLPSPGDRNTRYFYLVHVRFNETSSLIRKLRLTPGRRSLVIRPTIEGRPVASPVAIQINLIQLPIILTPSLMGFSFC